MTLKPWMVVNHKGMVLCLQCPTGRIGQSGDHYYLGLRKRAKRVTAIRWMRAHRQCGFEGLMH